MNETETTSPTAKRALLSLNTPPRPPAEGSVASEASNIPPASHIHSFFAPIVIELLSISVYSLVLATYELQWKILNIASYSTALLFLSFLSSTVSNTVFSGFTCYVLLKEMVTKRCAFLINVLKCNYCTDWYSVRCCGWSKILYLFNLTQHLTSTKHYRSNTCRNLTPLSPKCI